MEKNSDEEQTSKRLKIDEDALHSEIEGSGDECLDEDEYLGGDEDDVVETDEQYAELNSGSEDMGDPEPAGMGDPEPAEENSLDGEPTLLESFRVCITFHSID